MLRRGPTAITLTAKDVNDYDRGHAQREARAARLAEGQAAGSSAEGSPQGDFEDGQPPDPNDELKPLPGDRNRRYNVATPTPSGAPGAPRARTQDERIGLAR